METLKNYKKIFERVSTLLLIFIFGFFTIIKLRDLYFQTIVESIYNLPLKHLALIITLALLAFMTPILEDFIIIKDLNLKIENKKIFKAGFIGNSFNNLLSLGGLSGIKFVWI